MVYSAAMKINSSQSETEALSASTSRLPFFGPLDDGGLILASDSGIHLIRT